MNLPPNKTIAMFIITALIKKIMPNAGGNNSSSRRGNFLLALLLLGQSDLVMAQQPSIAVQPKPEVISRALCCKRPGVKIKTPMPKILFNDLVISAEKKMETASDGMVLQNKNRVDLVNRQAPNNSCRVVIRCCCGTITRGNQPLLIVDAIQHELSYLGGLNPDQIESVTIIKGAAASAIFGSNGSNGVIIVTTKKNSAKLAQKIKKDSLDKLLKNKIQSETIVQAKPSLSIYPNPVLRGQTCKISVTNAADMLLNIVVLDQSGRVMLQKETNAMGKEGFLSLMVGMGWPAGLYYVRVFSNDQTQKTNFQLASSFIVQ